MKKPDIPRLSINKFQEEELNIPLLKVEYYQTEASFSIGNRNCNVPSCYISPNRRKFYKLMHVTEGSGILTIGLNKYHIRPYMIAFIHPDEIISWQSDATTEGGHYCLIHPVYFEEAAHMVSLFKHYPYFQAEKAVVELDEAQSAKLTQYFENICAEEESENEDKKQAILLQLQMIFLEAKRAGKSTANIVVNPHYRYIHDFLALLESSLRVNHTDDRVKIKTAAEFAELLNVHPNYLNSLVKGQTGKTLREHIQERLVYEAKNLLMHTNWDIKAISYSLGFSEQASFTAFFQRIENISPSLFRDHTKPMVNS